MLFILLIAGAVALLPTTRALNQDEIFQGSSFGSPGIDRSFDYVVSRCKPTAIHFRCVRWALLVILNKLNRLSEVVLLA